MQEIKCLDCPKVFTPKAARQIRCKKCAAEKIRADDRERKRVKPAPVAPAAPIAAPAPIVVEHVGRTEPDITEAALSALDESQQVARLRAHRAWKEKYGAVVKPVAKPTETAQMDASELLHIASEPNIHEAGLTPSERSKRLTEHRAWADRSTKSSVGNLDYLFASKKVEMPLDPFLQEIQNTDAEHLTVFQTPNGGALYDRMPNGNVRESKLKFMRGQWFSKVAMEWQPLYEGSTVVVIKMATPIPSLNAVLEQKSTGEWTWEVPVTKVVSWPIAYLTSSKALIYPDGSPANLRSRNVGENFDIYGRLVMVIEISDPPFANFIISDEGHYIRKSSWVARSYWIEELSARIKDIEKREVDQELYAPTLKAWREEVELLQNDHFTIPVEVTVEPPIEPIKLPPIPDEPIARPQPPARVDVLDRQTRSDIARSEMMADGLDVVADGGYGDVESTLRASTGYIDKISDLEFARGTVISEKPESYLAQRRDIARAKRR